MTFSRSEDSEDENGHKRYMESRDEGLPKLIAEYHERWDKFIEQRNHILRENEEREAKGLSPWRVPDEDDFYDDMENIYLSTLIEHREHFWLKHEEVKR